MKTCPTCGRTYPDDAYVFCLEDGALLSAPRDSKEPRANVAPTTEVLKAPVTGRRPALQSTIPAPGIQPFGSPAPGQPHFATPIPGAPAWSPDSRAQYPVAAQTGPWLLRLALLLRGIAAIITSLALLFLARSFQTFFSILGIHVFIGGVLATVASVSSYRTYKRGGRFLVDAIASLVTGILILMLGLASPHTLFDILSFLLPIWAIIIGVAEIGAAIHLRTYISGDKLLAVMGALSVLFGIAKFLRLLPFAPLMAIYSVTFGVLLIVLGLKLRSKPRAS